MAQGTVQFFEEALEHICDGTIDLDTHTFKVALYNNTGAPTWAASTANPAYTVTNECSGTGYTAGGDTLTGVTWTEAAGTATFAFTGGGAWTQNGAGPTDIYWGLIYSDTAAGKDAIAYIDMGGAANISLQDGDITITPGTIFTLAL